MKPKYIVLHHSASPQNQSAQAIDDYHKKLWDFKSELGHYAGYQYIIEKDGNIFQARKDTETGAHAIGRNYDSIGICVVGWYDDGHDNLPTKEQQESLGKLLKSKMKEWEIERRNIIFHRDFSTKTCPGLHITQEFIEELLKENKKIETKKERNAVIIKKEYLENLRIVFKEVSKFLGKNYGKNPNNKEAEEIKKELSSKKEVIANTNKKFDRFKREIQDIKKITEKLLQ